MKYDSRLGSLIQVEQQVSATPPHSLNPVRMHAAGRPSDGRLKAAEAENRLSLSVAFRYETHL